MALRHFSLFKASACVEIELLDRFLDAIAGANWLSWWWRGLFCYCFCNFRLCWSRSYVIS
ncbi:unnamed protein product [Brassica oleracea]